MKHDEGKFSNIHLSPKFLLHFVAVKQYTFYIFLDPSLAHLWAVKLFHFLSFLEIHC